MTEKKDTMFVVRAGGRYEHGYTDSVHDNRESAEARKEEIDAEWVDIEEAKFHSSDHC